MPKQLAYPLTAHLSQQPNLLLAWILGTLSVLISIYLLGPIAIAVYLFFFIKKWLQYKEPIYEHKAEVIKKKMDALDYEISKHFPNGKITI